MRIYLLIILTLIFCISNNGQTSEPAIKSTPNQTKILESADALPSVKEKIADLRKQKKVAEERRNRLLATYTLAHPKVVKETENIASLDKEIMNLSSGNAENPAKFSEKEAVIITEITALRTQLSQCLFSKNKACADGSLKTKLWDTYKRALNYPNVVLYLFGEVIDEGNRPAGGTNNSNEQNLELLKFIVTQNQRMIELLEKLVNQKLP